MGCQSLQDLLLIELKILIMMTSLQNINDVMFCRLVIIIKILIPLTAGPGGHVLYMNAEQIYWATRKLHTRA